MSDKEIADHRLPGQWQFYIVPECKLPEQKTIVLNRVRSLGLSSSFEILAADATRLIEDLPLLKADLPPF